MAANFDPFTQNVILHDANGNPMPIPVGDVDDYIQYCIQVCISYGAQLGASVILLIILLILTRAEKRASYVFWLNCLALLLNFARLLCSILVFTSEFTMIYPFFSGDFSHVPTGAYANSILGVIFACLLITTLEISLVLQVQVVCSNLRRRWRYTVLGVSVLVVTVPLALRYWLGVVNIRNILSTADPKPFNRLEQAENICLTVSVCFFCLIFVTKLGFAIQLRRKLGLNEFGPTKVIFIMGCQTMIIPALFSIIQHFVIVPELAGNVLTLVTLSLPLSSIWAGVSLDRPASPSNARNLWQILSFTGKSTWTASTASTARQCTHCYSDSRPLTEREKDNDKKSKDGSSTSTSQHGIAVEHDISVESARRDSFGSV